MYFECLMNWHERSECTVHAYCRYKTNFLHLQALCPTSPYPAG
ncbi:MAG: hypothetical protein ACFFG0_19975 [Candidatus Thorarchaeota archaeon]